jgi:HD-like signal output (HDOD) protein
MPVSLTIRRLIANQPIELPVFHPIAIKLQGVLDSSDFTMDDVITLINGDQVLASQILKMANSTVYMGRVRTETIKDAVVRLGAHHVSNLAMAVSQSGLHVSANKVINDCLLSLWLHSHACALGSSWLAKTTGNSPYADRAYMAGLVHDVGKLFLLKALERLNKLGVAHTALEEGLLLEIFDELHVEQGCLLMQHWNMPKLFHDVVARHHEDKFDADDTLLVLVRLVDKACSVVGAGPGPKLDLDIQALPENDALQLTAEQIDELLAFLTESQLQLPMIPEGDAGSPSRSFEVDRRPFNLGWELVLLENGIEREKSIFPVGEGGYRDAETQGKSWVRE